MARYFTRTHPTVVEEDLDVVTASPVSQLVRVIAGIVAILLTLRLVLRAFGASTVSGFVRFIYNLTEPLVQPFFGIFSTNINYEFGTLELETVVAMLIYGLVAYLILAIVQSIRSARM